MGLHRRQIVGQHREPFPAAIEIGQGRRQGGTLARRLFHRVGEFGRMGRAQGNDGNIGIEPDGARGGKPDGAMGIYQFAGFAVEGCHRRQCLLVVQAVTGEKRGQAPMLFTIERQPPALAELLHRLRQLRAVAAEERGEPFAIVITDLGMPHIDGRKVASAIRVASPTTPIVLLTGWGQRLAGEHDVPAEVNRLLSKPPKLRELRAALAELTQDVSVSS